MAVGIAFTFAVALVGIAVNVLPVKHPLLRTVIAWACYLSAAVMLLSAFVPWEWFRWFAAGAGIAGLGVLLLVLAPHLPRRRKKSGHTMGKFNELRAVTKPMSLSPSSTSVKKNLSNPPLDAALRAQLKKGEELLHTLSSHNPVMAAATGGPIPASTTEVGKWESLTEALLEGHPRLQARFTSDYPPLTVIQLSTHNALYHRLDWRLRRLEEIINEEAL